MASVGIDGSSLRISLTRLERMLSLHGDLAFPVATVTEVVRVENPWPHLHGLRWPGAGIPDLVCVGSLRHRGERDFTAVYGRGEAVIITLAGEAFRRIILSGEAPALTGTSTPHRWGE